MSTVDLVTDPGKPSYTGGIIRDRTIRYAPIIAPEPGWQAEARCRGMGALFTAEDLSPENVVEAKAICLRCPVRTDCLDYSIEHRERAGIWGGLTENERGREIARRRKAERGAAA